MSEHRPRSLTDLIWDRILTSVFLKLPDDSNSHPALRMTKLNNFYDSLTYAKCFCKALEVKRRKNSDITL